jgi:predicted ATPase
MKLESLKVALYRSLKDVEILFLPMNLFIGSNASGKSSILDALRFMHEAIRERNFWEPVATRGGIVHLAWKGADAGNIELTIRLSNGQDLFEWHIQLARDGYEFSVSEDVTQFQGKNPPTKLLTSNRGKGWWWSEDGKQVTLEQSSTACALSVAAADAKFPARGIAEYVEGWGFFDPNPVSLRRGWPGLDQSRLDSHGRNLAERLFLLQKSSPDSFAKVVRATQSILGLPSEIEPRESDGRFYFAQSEPGLQHPVHQIGASSGTLRVLALMTALYGDASANLVGIEEPENHIHPTALGEFSKYLIDANERVQILVTTHSPLLLTFLNDPSAVCVVQRHASNGTIVIHETNPEGVRSALQASGFGLGELYETKGFGA